MNMFSCIRNSWGSRPSFNSGKIDVHCHYLPQVYHEALAAEGMVNPDGIAKLPTWDRESALRTMDKLGVAMTMLSISSPGVHFGNAEKACALARKVNIEGAVLKEGSKGRFGLLASVPLPDVVASVAEAKFALDELGANGLILESNAHGMYLGDPALDPLYSVLDSRSAVVLIHPTSPPCSNSTRIDKKIPRPFMEFMFDTTRTIVDMVTAGVLRKYPNISFIVAHAGAALPVLFNRVDAGMSIMRKPDVGRVPRLSRALKDFHFDLAGAPVPYLLRELLNVADENKLHYGSDAPFTPTFACKFLAFRLATTPLLTHKQRTKVFSENSSRLFKLAGGHDRAS